MLENLEHFKFSTLCAGLQVSSSGFHAWRKRDKFPKPVDLAVPGCHA